MAILQNKSVLITGADGFIGSHLSEMLVNEGCKVKALSQYNSFNNWGWLESIDNLENIEVLSGDIRDSKYCDHITENVDYIFHLAALIAIPYSYVAPESYVDTNIKGTLNICQAALDNKVEKIIHTSTSEVYGTAEYVPIDESHPLQPQSPYSASKIGADAMAMSYFNSFELPLVIARPFNTYGPRQSARAVIPSIISQLAEGKEEILVGDLSPTRDFNYVEDTCRGFIELAKHESAIGQTINIGSNYEISIRDTFNLIAEIMDKKVSFKEDLQRKRPKNSEVFRLWCDNNKMQKLTGYKPKYSIKEGLEKTIEWFLDPKNLEKYKSDIYNI
tara:strand:+ start:2475 stop:3470 length:996 start_codon:yes stop_codon:yes gene_type:complete